MQLPFIDREALDRLLPMRGAIDAVEGAFSAAPAASSPPRQHIDVGNGELLVMPASGRDGTGVKLVTVAPGNPTRGLPLIHGVYVLFAPDTLAPCALFDGAAITRLRTAAVSGVATKHLARSDAARLVVFGAGVQAEAHVEAMRTVRRIGHVGIVSRTPAEAEDLAARIGGIAAERDAVADADIVCTCTTSSAPVFDGSLLRAGAHVNAIGAYKPDARELDDAAIAAARVVVETRSSALSEAGDVAIPISRGVVDEDTIEELGSVIQSGSQRRSDEITIFKSVGVAFEDLAIATAAYGRLGTLELGDDDLPASDLERGDAH